MTRPALILLVEDNEMDVELTLDAFQEVRLNNAVHFADTMRQTTFFSRTKDGSPSVR